MAARPAVLIIHGGYFLPASWEPFVQSLRSKGYEVSIPRLPTCDDARPPSATVESDVLAVQSALKALISDGKSVVVLAHSYGGIVASEALTGDVLPSVLKIVMLSAWLVCPGSSIGDLFERYGFLCEVDLQFNEDGTASAKNPEHCFFNDVKDVDPARATELAKGNVTHNIAMVGGKVKGTPWVEVDTLYVHCRNDKSIMLPLQEGMVKEARHKGGRIETTMLESGHCPFLSRPEEVIEIIDNVKANA